MEIFRTIVPVTPSAKKIRYRSGIILSGSCFSEYIGNKLVDLRFQVENNPFGIVYNPFTVKKGISRLIDGVPYTENDLFLQNEQWCSFDHHSRFSDISSKATLDKINSRLELASEGLKNASFLFLTFGTSIVYELLATGEVVSNCHKLPDKNFKKRKLSVEDIIEHYVFLLQQIWHVNPGLQVVFTVSPIRHWKDGAHDNQLSKATLLLAVDTLCNTFSQCSYFPSYEIILDDLRDYRFYEEDMLHPNKTAIEYIWQHFSATYFETETLRIIKDIEQVLQAAAHRPFHSNSQAFKTFATQQLERIELLQKKDGIQLDKEEKYFKSFKG